MGIISTPCHRRFDWLVANIGPNGTYLLDTKFNKSSLGRIWLLTVPGTGTPRGTEPSKVAAKTVPVPKKRGLGLAGLLVELIWLMERPPQSLYVRDESDPDPCDPEQRPGDEAKKATFPNSVFVAGQRIHGLLRHRSATAVDALPEGTKS